MNPVNGINSNPPVQKIIQKPVIREIDPPPQTSGPDKVELSGVDPTATDIRADKVAEVKAQIADGTYESPTKLAIAIDRLIDDLAK